MAIQIPPGFALIDMAFRHGSYQRDAHVTYGVGINGNPEEVAIGALNVWLATMNTLLDSTVTVREVTATIGQDGGEPLIQQVTSTIPGGTSGEATPPALALLITKRSGLGGRRNTGRSFLPWFNRENAVSETGLIPTQNMTAYQTAATAWLLEHEEAELPMVILHRTGITAIPAPTPVTALVVSNVISTQRRRQVRNI